MKKFSKSLVALVLTLMMVVGTLIAAFAVDGNKYKNLRYTQYSALGDSISWGYGIDPDYDNSDPYSVGARVPGSWTDLVAKQLESNTKAVYHPESCSGARFSDFRVLLERGMGYENVYDRGDDWYGMRKIERTRRLRASGPQVCAAVKQSDLVSIQLGINDITTALVNAAYATGVVDLNRIDNISDIASVVDYLSFALGNLKEDPDLLGNLMKGFEREVLEIHKNATAVVKEVETLAPDDATILLVGYHMAVQGIRVVPGSNQSILFDLIDDALAAFNLYLKSLTLPYGNVYFVDIPDTSVVYPKGTTLKELLSNTSYILKGLHPDKKGHKYIATRVLDTLETIQA